MAHFYFIFSLVAVEEGCQGNLSLLVPDAVEAVSGEGIAAWAGEEGLTHTPLSLDRGS